MMSSTQGGFHKQQGLPFHMKIRLNTGRMRCSIVSIIPTSRILRDRTKPEAQCLVFFTSKINEIANQIIDQNGSNANTRLKIMQLIMLYSVGITFLTVFIGLMIEMVGLVVIGVISFLVYILSGLAIFFHFKPAYFQMCKDWNDEVVKLMPDWIEEYKQQYGQPDWIVDVSQQDGTDAPLPKNMTFEVIPPWFNCLLMGSVLTGIPVIVMVTHPCCIARFEAEETIMFLIQVKTAAIQQQPMQQAMQMGVGLMGLNMGVAMAPAPAIAAPQTGVPPPANQAANVQAQFANLDPGQQQLLLATMQAMQNGGGVSSGVEGVQLRTSEGAPATSEEPPPYTEV